MPKPTFDSLEESLILAGALGDPAELHGQLCGLACVMGEDVGVPWVTESLADASGSVADCAATERLLIELAGETLRALDEADMSLAALLPDDQEPLANAYAGAWPLVPGIPARPRRRCPGRYFPEDRDDR